jgi:hypothetical protein
VNTVIHTCSLKNIHLIPNKTSQLLSKEEEKSCSFHVLPVLVVGIALVATPQHSPLKKEEGGGRVVFNLCDFFKNTGYQRVK